MLIVNILGTDYKIIKKKYTEDELFEKNEWAGYCNEILKEIVVCDMKTYPNFNNATTKEIDALEKENLRHEIVHAFFNESGLSCCSLNYTGGWAKNEEMIDWIAIQGLKIYEAWVTVNAI